MQLIAKRAKEGDNPIVKALMTALRRKTIGEADGDKRMADLSIYKLLEQTMDEKMA